MTLFRKAQAALVEATAAMERVQLSVAAGGCPLQAEENWHRIMGTLV